MADQSPEDYARDQRVQLEDEAQARLVKEILAIVKRAGPQPVTPVRRGPDHKFEPYANPRVWRGCVKCPWPREAHPAADETPESLRIREWPVPR